MIVYFLRHGIAERQASGADRERKLTEEGKAGLQRVLAFANRAQVKPDLVLSSPYVRAVETAELAIRELQLEEQLSLADALVPESRSKDLWDDVRTQHADSVLVVSHEPLLSSTIAWILGSTKEVVRFPPGCLAAMEFASTGPSPNGVLRWMVTPDLC